MSLNNIIDYWKDRYKDQGFLTVGNDRTMEGQNLEYKIKEDFIFSYCPTKLSTLDYGCGVGRYCYKFDKYIGVDVTEQAVELAKKHNDKADFRLINLGEIVGYFDLFFTSTVLQHCSDEIVENIISNIQKYKIRGVTFCLYENSEKGESFHVKGRDLEYKEMISKYFDIKDYKSYTHTIHNENHTLHLIKT